MDIRSHMCTLGAAPGLACFTGAPEACAQRGTVLVYHGFGQSKDACAPVLQRLASAGFLAIGIDAIGHGERRYADFATRFPPLAPDLVGNTDIEAAFLEVVRASAHEIPGLIDTLIARGWVCSNRIGIAGHSFGGFVTYAAVVLDKRIQAAAAVVGSPEWKLPWPDSPHRAVDRFFPTAILSQTAGQDTQAPPDCVYALHQRLAPYYERAPERLRHIEYPNSAHNLSAADWDAAWQCVLMWFELFLQEEKRF
jgi:uncharacterized protein